jgi:hypothetical protein
MKLQLKQLKKLSKVKAETTEEVVLKLKPKQQLKKLKSKQRRVKKLFFYILLNPIPLYRSFESRKRESLTHSITRKI